MTKTRLTATEVIQLVDAQLLSKLTAENLKEVKAKVKTDELASTVVGEDSKGNVHKPYELAGVGQIQVIDSVRESVDTTMLIQKFGSVVDSDTLNQMVAECTKKTAIHTVNIKADKHYAVDFERKLKDGFNLLDELENVKEEVKQKVWKMINKQAN